MTTRQLKALEAARTHMLCRPWYWFFFKKFITHHFMVGYLRGWEEGLLIEPLVYPGHTYNGEKFKKP